MSRWATVLLLVIAVFFFVFDTWNAVTDGFDEVIIWAVSLAIATGIVAVMRRKGWL